MEEVDRIEYFKLVLSLIKSEDIRSFCEILLNGADDSFFSLSASSTGKHHPDYSNGEGGLARHSIATALILNDILSTGIYNFSDRETDLMICAAIVHDIKKYGNGSAFTVKKHPELASEYIIKTAEENHIINMDEAKFVADVVETHMGQYGSKLPETDAEKLVHIADCLSSRKYYNVDFSKLESPEAQTIIKTKVRSRENPGDYVINFGKHKGKMLKEVDESYLMWIVNSFENRNHPIVNKAKKLIS